MSHCIIYLYQMLVLCATQTRVCSHLKLGPEHEYTRASRGPGVDMCSITHAIGNPFDESFAANKGDSFLRRIHENDNTFYI